MANRKNNTKLPYSLAPITLPDVGGYHYVVSHLGSKDAASIYEGVVSKLPGQTSAGVELVWGALIDTVAENLAKYQYKSSVNGITFGLGIPNSTDSINGTPEEGEGVCVTITLPDSMRNIAAEVTPVYSASGGDTPTVKSVEELASRMANTIVGTDRFRIIGSNITTIGDDESLKVIAADGTEAMAEVDSEDGLGAFITAHLSAALPAGKGKVVLLTHGKRTPEGELHQCVKAVTILAGEPTPTPDPLDLTEVQTAGVNVGCVNETALTVLRGPNLPAWDGERDLCEVRYDGQSFACEHIEQDPDGYLEFNIPIAAGEVMSDGNQCQVYARINGREGSINAEWKH